MAIVITTIQPPTTGVQAIATHSKVSGSPLIVIGDRKSPGAWECLGADYYSFERQADLPFATARHAPPDSYTRKMLGYLIAARDGCSHIRETDDDNVPYDDFLSAPPATIQARVAEPIDSWVNIYPYFTDRYIWPRGFPLEHLRDTERSGAPTRGTQSVSGPMVLQAVADGDPDVDAIYRLTAADTSDVHFRRDVPLLIPGDSWTPFNSQATTWPIELLPLMYLPWTCSFRMTDIWRSFIAQRLFPSLGAHLVITAPTVFQHRNAHDLMRDFNDEIEGYTGYERFAHTLVTTPIQGEKDSVLTDLRLIYEQLVKDRFFAAEEIDLLDAWLADIKGLQVGAVT
jgi:hypothetical protein